MKSEPVLAPARRRLRAAIHRLERAEKAGTPLSRLRFIQRAHDSAALAEALLAGEIARLAGQVLKP